MASDATAAESCSWCGVAVETEDGFRAYEPAGARRAVFCRLEHVVPWAMQGPAWDAGELTEPPGTDEAAERCSHCDAELGEVHVLLVRHRSGFRIGDGFCSVDHMRAWAAAGGRWQS
jgi:hypothetical protein